VLQQVAQVLEARHLRGSLPERSRGNLLQGNDLLVASSPVRVIAVVGAGASASRFGRSNELIRDARALSRDNVALEAELRRNKVIFGWPEDSLESVLAAIGSDTSRERELRTLIADTYGVIKPPPLPYELLSHLLKNRYIDAIINFNFDEMLDESVRAEMGEGEFRFILGARSCRGIQTDPDKDDFIPLYVKPHGTASEPESLRFTLDSYYKLPDGVRAAMADMIGRGPALVLCFGFGLSGFDFSQLLAEPASGVIVDCSFAPLEDDARKSFERFAGDELTEVKVDWERDTRTDPSTPAARCDSPVTIAVDLGVANEMPQRGEWVEPAVDERPVVLRGARISYYWLEHEWLTDLMVPNQHPDGGDSNRGAQDSADAGAAQAADQVESVASGRSYPAEMLTGDPAASLVARWNLANEMRFKCLRQMEEMHRHDAASVQLLDLCSFLHERSLSQAVLASESPHVYRDEIRHLAVGLFLESIFRPRATPLPPSDYYAHRALIELGLLTIQARGVTTLENIAKSRVGHFINLHRARGGRAHAKEFTDFLQLKRSQRGVVTMSGQGHVDPAVAFRNLFEVVDTSDPRIDLTRSILATDTSELLQSWVEETDNGRLRGSIPDELVRDVSAHVGRCPSIPLAVRPAVIDFTTQIGRYLADARMDVEIQTRDDRVCSFEFVEPVKLATHSSLTSHSRRALKLVARDARPEPISLPPELGGEPSVTEPASNVELWVAASTASFLGQPQLLKGLTQGRDGGRRVRSLAVRLIHSSASDDPRLVGLPDLIADTVEAGDHPTRWQLEPVLHNQLPWWRVNRHLLLSLIDGVPVAAVYFVRRARSLTISPVFLSDPEDLDKVAWWFRTMWDADAASILPRASRAGAPATEAGEPLLVDRAGERKYVD